MFRSCKVRQKFYTYLHCWRWYIRYFLFNHNRSFHKCTKKKLSSTKEYRTVEQVNFNLINDVCQNLTCSRWFDPPPSFEAVYCVICGRRRVAVARYRMVCLVLKASAHSYKLSCTRNKHRRHFLSNDHSLYAPIYQG